MILLIALVVFFLGGLCWWLWGPFIALIPLIVGAIIALRLGAASQEDRMRRAMRDRR